MTRAFKRMNRSWLEVEYNVQYVSCGASPTGSNADSATSQLYNLASYYFLMPQFPHVYSRYDTNSVYLNDYHEQILACG